MAFTGGGKVEDVVVLVVVAWKGVAEPILRGLRGWAERGGWRGRCSCCCYCYCMVVGGGGVKLGDSCEVVFF